MIAPAPAVDVGSATETWDFARELLLSGELRSGMELISENLHALRNQQSGPTWRLTVQQYQRHPVFQLVRQAPLAGRALRKPRNYARDAVMLDYIYGMAPCPDETTRLGAALYAWEYDTLPCRAVRSRMSIIAEEVDQLAGGRRAPRVMSVACGHLREASRLASWNQASGPELIAIDQDPLSIRVVERTYGWMGVRPLCQDVRSLVKDRSHGDFDLVYALGLYDYLNDRWAQGLSSSLFRMLRPGGRLIVANFRDFSMAAYLEACMSWWLTYRCENDMGHLMDRVPPDEVASQRIFHDETEAIVFLEATRA